RRPCDVVEVADQQHPQGADDESEVAFAGSHRKGLSSRRASRHTARLGGLLRATSVRRAHNDRSGTSCGVRVAAGRAERCHRVERSAHDATFRDAPSMSAVMTDQFQIAVGVMLASVVLGGSVAVAIIAGQRSGVVTAIVTVVAWWVGAA